MCAALHFHFESPLVNCSMKRKTKLSYRFNPAYKVSHPLLLLLVLLLLSSSFSSNLSFLSLFAVPADLRQVICLTWSSWEWKILRDSLSRSAVLQLFRLQCCVHSLGLWLLTQGVCVPPPSSTPLSPSLSSQTHPPILQSASQNDSFTAAYAVSHSPSPSVLSVHLNIHSHSLFFSSFSLSLSPLLETSCARAPPLFFCLRSPWRRGSF